MGLRRRVLWSALVASGLSTEARADDPFETVVTARPDGQEELADERATSSVGRKEIEGRLPRSAPDALRYEPGVFVQQSAAGQGSAYLRGLTGQQTLLLFDGIRMNTSTYRQGPNQYFFTLDSRTIRSIEVERGGASTRWGADALGGVIDTHPIEPTMAAEGFQLEPRLYVRGASADSDLGGRLQVDTALVTTGDTGIAFVGGFGGRKVGLLHGPPVLNPISTTDAGYLPWVPRYKGYDPTRPFAEQTGLRTELGTGFDEAAGDGRLVLKLKADQELTVAGYLYREYNAPRTDQCPPPTAPYDQCLTYEEQFHDLAYAAWKGRLGAAADEARVTLSWQQQHERRRLDLTAANLIGHGIDDVQTYGVTARAKSKALEALPWLMASLAYGVDNYLDWVRSRAEHSYSDTGDSIQESRGQYLDRSTYVTGGAYGDLQVDFDAPFAITAGLRAAWAAAHATGDPQSGTLSVDRFWHPLVGHTGLEWRVSSPVRLFVNYDNSFRAPNLDDLTSRQQTGPGFQFENPALEVERANTLELGGRLRTSWLVADAWLFETLLDHAIVKVSKPTTDCPANTPQCLASWSRFQLENSPSYSELRGAEGAAKLYLPARVSLRATVSYVWSEGPRLGTLSYGVDDVTLGQRVPLSRTPPLNGTVELSWASSWGLTSGAALQWAAAQTRLAIADYADGRIPKYGTPGFAVVHLRAAYRLDSRLLVALVLENVFDSPYRFHGSSINGAGRGLMAQLEAAHWL
jgi:outer membrane receptor protein involved in Fe transport